MNRQIRNYIFMLSCILVLAGAILYLTHRFYASYLFAVGAAGITVSFMAAPYQNLNFRFRRLHRINVLAGISLIASSVFMFRGEMAWVVFLLISALLMLYTSFVGPRSDD
jgi:hypothetical protein